MRDVFGGELSYERDAAGRITLVTKPNGNQLAYTFDADGNVLDETVDPGAAPHLNQTTSFDYDLAGNKTAQTDARGWTTTYAYNGNDELMSETYPVAGGGTGTVTYGYDAAGRQTAIADEPANSVVQAYDAAGRVTSVTSPKAQQVTRTTMQVGGPV